jgi:hypothetical protein
MWDADEGGVPNGKDVAGIFQRINSYRVAESTREDIEKGILGVFVFIDATNLQNGQPMPWQTGATGIISKLRWLESKDLLGTPAADCYVKEVPTQGGNTLLKLRPMPKAALQSAPSA